MKLVVTDLYKDVHGITTGSEGIVLFFKDTNVVHVEKFYGKCTSKYVRAINKDLKYDTMLALPTVVGGVFEASIIE